MAIQLSLTLILTLLSLLITTTTSIPARELDTMLASLRSQRSYSLIANAISTSDIKLTLLNTPSFTLFAPTDSSLFALDVSATTTASYYVSVLCSHFVPNRRLSATDIRRLASPSSFPSMLHARNVRVQRDAGLISIDGVDLVFPGLFYARNVAVHGLAGILPGSSPPIMSTRPSRRGRRGRRVRNGRGRSLPKVGNSTIVISPPENVNHTFLSPLVPDNDSSLPVNGSVFAPSPSPRNDSGFFSVSLPPAGTEMTGAPVSISLPPTRTEIIGAPVGEGRHMMEKCDSDRMAGQFYASFDL